MRKGKALERLVMILETVLCQSKDTSINSPHRMRDRVTGKLREHDVVLITRQGHHEFVTAIECRDRSRPIGVDAVEAFNRKCSDTHVDRSVMVSSTGFRNTARVKAKFYGIDCLDLNTSATFDWMKTGAFKSIKISNVHFAVTGVPDQSFTTKPQRFRFSDQAGREITAEEVSQMARELLTRSIQPPLPPSGPQTINFILETPGCTVVDLDTGDSRPLKHFFTRATCYLELSDAPFTNASYSRELTGEAIGNASIADLTLAGQSASIVFLQQGDGSIEVKLVLK